MIYVHPRYWEDNGFAGLQPMMEGFKRIAAFLGSKIDKSSPQILDTYCRNGALLHAVRREIPDMIPWGMSTSPSHIAHAEFSWKKYAHHFSISSMADCPWPFPQVDVAIVMPGRILEIEEDQRDRATDELFGKAKAVVAYSFPDWAQERGFEGLCNSVGLALTGDVAAEGNVYVSFVERKDVQN